jgi:cell division transport system permease protein
LVFRLSYVFAEAYRGFRRNLLLAGSMVIIVAISLTLFGIALLAGKQVSLFGGFWANKIQVSVFLAKGVTREKNPDQVASIERQLRTPPLSNVIDQGPEGIQFETQAQAYQRFKEQFKDSPDMVRNVTQDALPESFRIKLKNPNDRAAVSLIHDTFCFGTFNTQGHENCQPGIDSVVDQRQLVERLFAVLNMLKNSFFVLAGVLGAAAVVLIAVTVRVAAFARRRETQIMKLVGASNTYIRLPFLAEGVVAGLLGTGVAFALLGGGMYYLNRIRSQVVIFQFLPVAGMHEYYSACVVLLVLGVTASALASLLALRKYVRV